MKPSKKKPTKSAKVRKNMKRILAQETDPRIVTLLKITDDGRKRATQLPPLAREASFQRKPKHFNKFEASANEPGDSHWHIKHYKPVSMEVDRKVVTHLRRQLNKRIEASLLQGSIGDSTEFLDGEAKFLHAQGKKNSAKENIFNKYSELGEKIHDKPVRKRKEILPISPPDTQRSDVTLSSDISLLDSSLPTPRKQTTMNENVNIKHMNGSVTRLPEVNGHPIVLDGVGQNQPLMTDEENIFNDDAYQTFHLTGIETKDVEIRSFRDLEISPIQTPVLHRPLTREQTRLSITETMKRVLKGHVHRSCPLDNKVFKIYVSAYFADSDAERTTILDQTLPELRKLCGQYGRQLEFYDLHWGLKDAILDDHSLPETCLSTIESCISTNVNGISLIVFLTDKYGSYLLPSKIPMEEFEAIETTARRSWQQNMDTIKTKRAEIEGVQDSLAAERTVTSTVADGANVSAESKSRDQSDGISNNQSGGLEGDGDKDTVQSSRKAKTDEKKEQQLLKALKEQEEALPDAPLLTQWYKLDANAVPPVYKLQNISAVYKEIEKGDATHRDIAKGQWKETSGKILRIFQEYAPKVITDPYALRKYSMSLLDMELEQSILKAGDMCGDRCMVVRRIIKNMVNMPDEENAGEFLDLSPSLQKRADRKKYEQLIKIRDDVILNKVPGPNVITFDIDWAPGGVRLGGDRSHQTYLDRFCKQFTELILRRLKQGFEEESESREQTSDLYREVSQHVNYCHERSKTFQGRKEILQDIKSYLRSDYRCPLVVHGQPGCGKTAILSKAAKEVHKWLKGTSVAVVIRVIGVTTASCNIRSLLHGICLQLCEIFNNDPELVPDDYKGLVNYFAHRISQSSKDHILVIFIDSLDRLTDDHNGRSMSWLPRELPSHTRIVVSTLPDSKFECLENLKKIFAERNDIFLEVDDLHDADAIAICEHWYNKQKRTITSEQYEVLLEAFRKCPSPLYLKLIFGESLSWPTYMPINQIRLSDTVRKMASFKFGQLEIRHREPLVRRAVGYITASRNGIADSEMIDLLSLDDVAMDDVFSNWKPPKRRFPTIHWVRLRNDLNDYLRLCAVDNAQTLQWDHSQFHEAAEDRYLNQRDKAPSYHKALAEYFMGMWADKPKPYSGNDKGALRYVAAQPFYFEETGPDGKIKGRKYNLRKVNELPYHLLNSQQMDLYKSEAMCNFEWVLAKLCGTSLGVLLEEYHIGLKAVDSNEKELKTLSDTLQLSAKALMKDPRQLAGQMVGRLQGILNRDVPSTIGDPPRYPCLHGFIAQAKNTSIPTLVPSIACLTEPGGILFDLLSGHSEPITAACISTDGQWSLTASRDNTLKIWDLKSGKVILTIGNIGRNVTKLKTAYNNRYVITVEGSVMKIWSIRTKECVFIADKYVDPPVITTAAEGKLLVGVFDGINMMRTWDMDDNFKLICESKLEDQGIFKDDSVVVAPNSYGDYILHAFRGGSSATIKHARTGNVIHVLKCNDASSSVSALAISRDYMILACRQHYMKLHEIYVLELFDAKKGKYLRTVRGCVNDLVTELHINLVGSHAIAICASEASNSSNIAIWNLETEDHKHLARHAGVSTIGACGDFRYCLTAQKDDKTLRIWNISSKINQPMPKLKKSLGVAEIHPVIENPRYVIARQVHHGPVSIWNVAKAKCLTNAVRIERGLSDTTDVVLIRNTNVIILTEKGLKESRLVYKTILMYDLRQKRYTKKINGCFIVPSPQNEYVLLDDEHLLGPADTRNHFIIWSLENGKEIFRIKPNFKDILRGGIAESDLARSLSHRASTAKMTPWDRRIETKDERQKRHDIEKEGERKRLEELKKEKENGLEQYIVSGNMQVIVASFFAHHLCVFDIPSKLHVHTLENEDSMMFLHVAALSYDGKNLVHTNYDEKNKISYVTLWDTFEGQVKKRLKHETDVIAIAMTDDASRIVFGKASNEMRVWDPMKQNGMKRLKGFPGLNFEANSKIFLVNNGTKAVVLAKDISMWDLENMTVLATFSPDTKIECCAIALNGQLVTFGVHDFSDLVILKLYGKGIKQIEDTEGEDIFGETTGDTSEEEDEED
ncbi:hypothetical protein CHS0354_010319 [Potamilus streckersoni]|uniref:Uncharacterized protein n=1 Tax=Potamilus streckersoni TaxID=2493646 RepID=A0AAE0TDP7_9BIVA|nr:hypothetical protein CHS0354_010319 [Potamilus streckersoni]